MITYKVSWTQLKSLQALKNIPIQCVDIYDDKYNISLNDAGTIFHCTIFKETPSSTDQTDFETNYLPSVNKPNTTVISPFNAKILTINGVTKKLYSRFTGIQYPVITGSNTLTYTVTYPWAKLLGVEAINCEALDTVDFKVYDTALGNYSGIPNALLNQFSFTLNLSKDYYQRMAQFDADLYAGMIIEITYVSQSNKTIGINFFLNEVKS